MAADLISKLLAPDPKNRPSIEMICKHPFIIGPFSTERLSPISKSTRSLHMSINDEGHVKLHFLKNNSTIEVTKNGDQIFINGEKQNATKCTFETLPSSHWKKYVYAWKFVELVKAKTPKIIFYSTNDRNSDDNTSIVKCCLMENSDFEVSLQDNAKNEVHKMIFNESTNLSDAALRLQLLDLRDKCFQIERQLEDTKRLTSVECFPAVLGPKNKIKRNEKIQISMLPSITSSHVLRSVSIKGIGVASQVKLIIILNLLFLL